MQEILQKSLFVNVIYLFASYCLLNHFFNFSYRKCFFASTALYPIKGLFHVSVGVVSELSLPKWARICVMVFSHLTVDIISCNICNCNIR
jgi:hypothetical protein